MYREELKYFSHVYGIKYDEIFVPGKLHNFKFDCWVEETCDFCKSAARLEKFLDKELFSRELSSRSLSYFDEYLADNADSDFWISNFSQFARIFLEKDETYRKIEKIMIQRDRNNFYINTGEENVSKLTLLANVYDFNTVVEAFERTYLELARDKFSEFWKDFVSMVQLKIKSREDGLDSLSMDNLLAIYGEI